MLLLAADALALGQQEALVVNDQHGALSVALSPKALWTDSYLSARATSANAAYNATPEVDVSWSTTTPPVSDTVVLRVPKSSRYFEFQLATLAALMPHGATLIAAGMDKHLSPGTATLLERHIGPTERRPGQKKARLFIAARDASIVPVQLQPSTYQLESLPFELTAQSNVFSPDRLDPGTRLLLTQLPALTPVSKAVDLACGNGVVGLHLLNAGLTDSLLFADESAMAIAAATVNLPQQWAQKVRFHHGDGIAEAGVQPDLVVLNPPFHMGHAVDEYAGRRLIHQASAALADGGKLLLVFNSHLKYRDVLRRTFRTVTELARDKRFSVILATKA